MTNKSTTKHILTLFKNCFKGIIAIWGDYMFRRIRDLREDRDLTQKFLAEHLQIYQTTYSDYELGNLNIPIDVLIKLAQYYETSIDYLVELTDNPKPYK